jgi:hypothetical protein
MIEETPRMQGWHLPASNTVSAVCDKDAGKIFHSWAGLQGQ